MKVICSKYLDNGSYADIWIGTDDLNRQVAIKVMKAAGAAVSTLEQHANVLIRAKHINVVDVYSIEDVNIPDVGTQRSMIMEFITGETLDKFLKHEQSDSILYEVGAQIIEGLEYIHTQGLVHMDLHEQNIMVTDKNKVKLIDIMYRSSLKDEIDTISNLRVKTDLNLLTDILSEIILKSQLGQVGVNEFKNIITSNNSLSGIKYAYHDVFTFARSRFRVGNLFYSGVQGFEKLRLYKFRAECLHDVLDFINLANKKIRGYRIDNDYIPDVEVEIATEISKTELLNIMSFIPDGHVMSETLETIHEYTGERK